MTLPLRVDWGTASPVPNPEMCEELENLKRPQQKSQALCESAEADTRPCRVQTRWLRFSLYLKWRAEKSLDWIMQSLQGSRAIGWKCTRVKLVFCFHITSQSYKSCHKLLTILVSKRYTWLTIHEFKQEMTELHKKMNYVVSGMKLYIKSFSYLSYW